MTTYTFTVVIEKEPEDPSYYAHCSELPGCFSDGRTIDEARARMKEAIELHVDALRAAGDPIPATGETPVVTRVTVEVPS
jgi:predicted RNase H-like HicB family nuclease